MPWLRRSNLWPPTMGNQRETNCYTKQFNGIQEAKGLCLLCHIHTKARTFRVKSYNRGQNTLRRYFIKYSGISLKISGVGFK